MSPKLVLKGQAIPRSHNASAHVSVDFNSLADQALTVQGVKKWGMGRGKIKAWAGLRRPPRLGASKWVATPSATQAPPPRSFTGVEGGGGGFAHPREEGRAGPVPGAGRSCPSRHTRFQITSSKRPGSLVSPRRPRAETPAPRTTPPGQRRPREPGHTPQVARPPARSRGLRGRKAAPGDPGPRPAQGRAGRTRRAGRRKVPHFPRPVPAGLPALRCPARPGE